MGLGPKRLSKPSSSVLSRGHSGPSNSSVPDQIGPPLPYRQTNFLAAGKLWPGFFASGPRGAFPPGAPHLGADRPREAVGAASAVPEEGRIALLDLTGSFEGSGVGAFGWLGEFLATEPAERAAQLAEVRDGYRTLAVRYRERCSQLERDWQEGGVYDCARGYGSPYVDTSADAVVDELRTRLG